jgi:hypothetical protein
MASTYINRDMTFYEQRFPGTELDDLPDAVHVVQGPAEDVKEHQFAVSRYEAPDLIRMLADAFGFDLDCDTLP